MKKLSVLILMSFWMAHLFAQKDTVKVIYEYKQEIVNGKHTPKYWVICQTVKDMNDNMLRQYFFDDSLHQLSSYIWYFYKDSRLYTKECYSSSDSLKCLNKYTYDNFGNKTEVVVFKNAGHSIIEFQKNIYNYSDGKKLSCKQYNNNNKINVSARYYYNLQGKPIKESYKYKSRSGSDLKSEIKTMSYNNDQIDQEINQTKYRDGHNEEIFTKYMYNDSGLLIKKVVNGKDNKPLKHMEYTYYPHGSLNIYREYDGTGKLIKLLSYKYEIHAITPGTFKSYLDKIQKN